MGRVEIRKRRTWRRRTYIWTLSGLTAISALIYWEQTALLFVLATLTMSALLIIVAFADLEGRDKELHKQANSLNKSGTESSQMKTSPVPALPNPTARKRQAGRSLGMAQDLSFYESRKEKDAQP